MGHTYAIHFIGHFSRWTWISCLPPWPPSSLIPKLCILEFPMPPGLQAFLLSNFFNFPHHTCTVCYQLYIQHVQTIFMRHTYTVSSFSALIMWLDIQSANNSAPKMPECSSSPGVLQPSLWPLNAPGSLGRDTRPLVTSLMPLPVPQRVRARH